MRIRTRRSLSGRLALALSFGAIAITGCGGSSKPPANASGTGTSAAPQSLSPATEVSSPAYRAFVARGLAQIPGVPRQSIPRIISCIIQKQLGQGITTVAAVNARRSVVNADGVACAHAAGLR